MDKKTIKKPKVRKKWIINPKTQVKKSKKSYKRQEAKKELKEFVREVKNGKDA